MYAQETPSEHQGPISYDREVGLGRNFNGHVFVELRVSPKSRNYLEVVLTEFRNAGGECTV